MAKVNSRSRVRARAICQKSLSTGWGGAGQHLGSPHNLEVHYDPLELLRGSRLPLPRLLALRHRNGEKAPLCGSEAQLWAMINTFLSSLPQPGQPTRLPQATSLSLCTGLHRAPVSSSCLSGSCVKVPRMAEGKARSSRGRVCFASDLSNNSPPPTNAGAPSPHSSPPPPSFPLPSPPGTHFAPSHHSLAPRPVFSLNSDTAHP